MISWFQVNTCVQLASRIIILQTRIKKYYMLKKTKESISRCHFSNKMWAMSSGVRGDRVIENEYKIGETEMWICVVVGRSHLEIRIQAVQIKIVHRKIEPENMFQFMYEFDYHNKTDLIFLPCLWCNFWNMFSNSFFLGKNVFFFPFFFYPEIIKWKHMRAHFVNLVNHNQ